MIRLHCEIEETPTRHFIRFFFFNDKGEPVSAGSIALPNDLAILLRLQLATTTDYSEDILEPEDEEDESVPMRRN